MQYNLDGYVNATTGFGTARDSSAGYSYEGEGLVPDMLLTQVYESDGLFSKIIDRPAEETMKRGYDFDGLEDDAKTFVNDMLDYLEWDEQCITAVKWARLFGGGLAVLLVDDGEDDLENPLNYARISNVEEILLFDRSVVQPDYNSMYRIANMQDHLKHGRSNFGKPEHYAIFSQYGHFRVHESRCLVFRNGKMPERSSQMLYRFWGVPEYLRIKDKLQEANTSATYAVELLERCVQAVYGMLGLSDILDTDDGAERLLKRISAIDLVRSIRNTMVIDTEGESYDFRTATLSGVNEIIDSTCNMLSAVTNIPQTVLFGRSPAGMNATGESDFENYYSFIERIQKTQILRNFEKLVDIILIAAQNRGLFAEVPNYKIAFNPLKTVSEQDQATVDQQKATTQQIKAQTAQILIDAQVLDPPEVRRALAKEGDWDIETVLDELTDKELMEVPEDGAPDDPGEINIDGMAGSTGYVPSVGVLVVNGEGKVLIGRRSESGLICGPGGKIEDGETPEQAAVRETQEEFGITPKRLKLVGRLNGLKWMYGRPYIFLCTEYEGAPKCSSSEMHGWEWRIPNDIAQELFPPFAESLRLLKEPPWSNTITSKP